jgi:glycogen debranching enzyme
MAPPTTGPHADGRASPTVTPATDSASPAPRRHVLKHGDCFAVLDAFGDVQATMPAAEGLFYEDTRYLSQLTLAIDGVRPLLLSSTVSDDDAVLVVDLAGTPVSERGRTAAGHDTVHVVKRVSVGDGTMFASIELRNFGIAATSLRLGMRFEADFVDIFELRGTKRLQHGRRLEDEATDGGSILTYIGRDGVTRRTRLTFTPPPNSIDDRQALWLIDLPAKGARTVKLAARCERSDRPADLASSAAPRAAARRPLALCEAGAVRIHTSSASFDDVIARACADLDMLATQTPQGLYPYAGLPWFSTPFGRDGLITSLQCLWLHPAFAAGTLRCLAAWQATSIDEAADAEPGKILHEARAGEMAAIGEVPYRRYYGSIDATPLFVVLAAAYYARTGDIDLVRELWPNIEAALAWMAEYGDADGDGFLEYKRKSADGLVNQGWRDSGDAVFHADGNLAEPPIALAEVQAYAYAAYIGAADLAHVLGHAQRSTELYAVAGRLQRRFEDAFWLEEYGTYALALDGAKRPCRVRASTAGQVLFGGVASVERAARVCESLMSPNLYSRWGIRTIAEDEIRYNPMSYHNGSVWPHDNSIIAMGFARYGLKKPIAELLTGLADAARFMEMKRLPEFFCGFARRPGFGPISHPIACAPQAWASASIIAMLGALLGLSFEPAQHRIRLTRPLLPPWMETCALSNLRLGAGEVDLLLERRAEEVAVHVVRRVGAIDVAVTT